MAKLSAGILRYKWIGGQLQVLLVHHGGPFWHNKDLGSWSVPKGEYSDSEDPLTAAKREFSEETGIQVNEELHLLGQLKQPSGKIITVWTMEGDCSLDKLTSNTFSMEWPPKSGKMQDFPEVDAACWYSVEVALTKILGGQRGFIDMLAARLSYTYTSTQPGVDVNRDSNNQKSLFG